MARETTGGSATELFTLGARHVAVNGAITAVTGTHKIYQMDPPIHGTPGFTGVAADENYTDATGCKAFYIDADTISSGDALAVAWSTTASDSAATQAAATTAATNYDAPAGAAESNVLIITPSTSFPQVVYWDGENRIKTISMCLTTAGTVTSVTLHTVE